MPRKIPIGRHSLSHRSQVDLRECTWALEIASDRDERARLYRTDDAVPATDASFTDLTAAAGGIVGAEPNAQLLR